jgi:hypothetical protein
MKNYEVLIMVPAVLLALYFPFPTLSIVLTLCGISLLAFVGILVAVLVLFLVTGLYSVIKKG